MSPDAEGKIRGIALGGKAADAWLRIFGQQEELFERQPPTFDELCPVRNVRSVDHEDTDEAR